MALIDKKVEESEYAGHDITGLSNTPSKDGVDANTLKARFDSIAKTIIIPKYNALIDMLTSTVTGSSGARSIGFESSTKIPKTNVYDAIDGAYTYAGNLVAEAQFPSTLPRAENISVVDSGNYFTGTNVETALQEVGLKKVTKPSLLTEKTSWADTDIIIIEDGADTKKMTVATFKGLIKALTTITKYTETISVTTAQTTLLTSHTASTAKKVIVSFCGAADTASFTGTIELKILVNGIQQLRTCYYYNASGYPQPQAVIPLTLGVNDVVTFGIFQSSGSNKSFICNMELTQL